MKFSKNFDRDWNWYFKYKDVFTFSGSPPKEIKKEKDIQQKKLSIYSTVKVNYYQLKNQNYCNKYSNVKNL